MTDKKLTDNEIIKAWECCMDEMGCTKGCPCFNPKAKGSHCTVAKKLELEKLTLDLINRQKAEIERLKEKVTRWKENYESSQVVVGDFREIINKQAEKLKTAKAETIKEFAERLKKNEGRRGVPIGTIDNLVKEMVGDVG